MKRILLACFMAGMLSGPAVAMQDDDLSEQPISTDTLKGEDAADDEDAQGVIQESDEDLAGFVQDYIKKDTDLKGAFFIEDAATKRVLKLKLDSVLKKPADGENGTKIVEAVFKDLAGKKYSVLFHMQNVGFGVDIFKVQLKTKAKPSKK